MYIKYSAIHLGANAHSLVPEGGGGNSQAVDFLHFLGKKVILIYIYSSFVQLY